MDRSRSSHVFDYEHDHHFIEREHEWIESIVASSEKCRFFPAFASESDGRTDHAPEIRRYNRRLPE